MRRIKTTTDWFKKSKYFGIFPNALGKLILSNREMLPMKLETFVHLSDILDPANKNKWVEGILDALSEDGMKEKA